MDPMMEGLMNIMNLRAKKEGRSEEELLAEMSTPEGMEHLMNMMSLIGSATSGAAGSIHKTTKIAQNTGRLFMYMDAIKAYFPSWFGDQCNGCSGKLHFAVDLASANALYPSRFTFMMPHVKWYASEKIFSSGEYLGLKMTEDCLEYMAAACPKAEKPSKSSMASGAGDEDEDDPFLEIDTVQSRTAAKRLRGRVACVDVMDKKWDSLEHLSGRCSVVLCTSLLTQLGYTSPDIWMDVICGAEPLLEENGILIMYDTEKWGGYGDEDAMKACIDTNKLQLKLVSKEEPIDYTDDPDGRMYVLTFQKFGDAQCRSSEWLLEKADQLKNVGNGFFTTKASSKRGPKEESSSSPRAQVLWKAVACYVQALDCTKLTEQIAKDTQEHVDGTGTRDKVSFLRSRLFCNLAAAYLELMPVAETYEEALAAVNEAIEHDPAWEKAKERKAKILDAKGKGKQEPEASHKESKRAKVSSVTGHGKAAAKPGDASDPSVASTAALGDTATQALVASECLRA